MGARERLNSLYVLSAVSFAAVIGAVFASWKLFTLIAVVSWGLMLSDARIRLNSVRHWRHRRSRRRPH